jgi:hypothetical protein
VPQRNSALLAILLISLPHCLSKIFKGIACLTKISCAGLCQRRGWKDPLYECYRRSSGFTCQVLVNGREYLTDVEYESDGLAQENAAMRAFMVCRNFSINGGMLARNGVVQGLPVQKHSSRHRRYQAASCHSGDD